MVIINTDYTAINKRRFLKSKSESIQIEFIIDLLRRVNVQW